MELPEDVCKLIREYSQPITRPDWRRLHIMPKLRFHQILARDAYNNRIKRKVAYELLIDLYLTKQLQYE
jgi:hypothetical protein